MTIKNLSKFHYHGKNNKSLQNKPSNKKGSSYAQVSFGNIKEILSLKDKFTNLLSKKIEDIHRTINDTKKMMSHINMTTKGSSHKHVTNSKP